VYLEAMTMEAEANGAAGQSSAASSDNLGDRYAAAAKDKSLAPKEREAASYFTVAEAHLHEEQADEALRNAEEALSRFRQLGDENGVADTTRLIIHVLTFQEKRKDANRTAKSELERIRSGKDRRGEGRMLLALAEVNSERRGHKNREEALGFATEALQRFRAEGDKKLAGYALIVSLNIHMKRRADRKTSCQIALGYALEARPLFKAVGDRRGEGLALHGMAVSLVRAELNGFVLQGSPGTWQSMAQEAAQIFKEGKFAKMEAFEKVCIAQWHLNWNPRQARKLAEEAMKCCQQTGSRQEGAALGVLVQSLLAAKDVSLKWMTEEAELAVQLAKDGAARFKERADKPCEALALNALVLAYQAKESHLEALATAEAAADLYSEIGEKGGETAMLQVVAQLHLKHNQPEKARKVAQEVTDLGISLHETAIAQETAYEAFLQLGDVKEALRTAVELQLLCEDKCDRKREAIARLMIANIHYTQKEYSLTVMVAREAQALLHDLGAWTDEAAALRVVAEAYLASQEFDKALKAADRALRLLRGKGKGTEEAHTMNVVALVKLQILGQDKMKAQRGSTVFARALAEAAGAADDAAVFARSNRETSLEGQALLTLGQVQLLGLQVDEALKASEQAMSVFLDLKDERNQANTMCLQADIHLTNGLANKALVLVNKALAIFQDHNDKRGEWIAMGILEQITGPEEQSASSEQWTDEQWAQWEQWQQSQQQTPQQRPPQQRPPQPPQTEMATQPRKARTDLGTRLDMSTISVDSVRHRLIEIVRNTVDLDDEEEIALDMPLMQVGITSRTAVQLRNNLSEEIPGVSLPFTLIFDYPSVAAISDMILEGLPG